MRNNVGKALKMALVMRNVSRRDLAAALGRPKGYVDRQCMRADGWLSETEEIAKVLGFSFKEFLALGDYPDPPDVSLPAKFGEAREIKSFEDNFADVIKKKGEE